MVSPLSLDELLEVSCEDTVSPTLSSDTSSGIPSSSAGVECASFPNAPALLGTDGGGSSGGNGANPLESGSSRGPYSDFPVPLLLASAVPFFALGVLSASEEAPAASPV